MIRRTFVLLVLVGCVAPVTTTLAADYGIGIRAGTQGFGLEGAVGVKEWVTVRGGVYRGDVSADFDEGGIDYDADLELGGFGVLGDFFPRRGKFRITAGLFSSQNEYDVFAVPTENIEIGDSIYTPAEAGTLRGKADFDSTAPYVGIGWGNAAAGKRVGFLFDFGVLHQGSGDVTLSTDSALVDPDDIAQEIAEIEDDIDDFDFWPVISFGVAVRF